MYNFSPGTNNKAEVIVMKQKKDDSAAHELHDRPLPPVKGAVNGPQDLRPRPEREWMAETVNLGDSASMDSWM